MAQVTISPAIFDRYVGAWSLLKNKPRETIDTWGLSQCARWVHASKLKTNRFRIHKEGPCKVFCFLFLRKRLVVWYHFFGVQLVWTHRGLWCSWAGEQHSEYHRSKHVYQPWLSMSFHLSGSLATTASTPCHLEVSCRWWPKWDAVAHLDGTYT